MSSYPTGLDDFATAMAGGDFMATPVSHSSEHRKIGDALEKIEGELGLSPSGDWTTLASRLLSLTEPGLEVGPAGVSAGATGLPLKGPVAVRPLLWNSYTQQVCIDEGSLKAEVAHLEPSSGTMFNLREPLFYDHDPGAPVRHLVDGYVNPSLFGGRGDFGEDNAMALQRAIACNKATGLGDVLWWFEEPLFFTDGHFWRDFSLYQAYGGQWRSTGQHDPCAPAGQETGFVFQNAKGEDYFECVGSTNTFQWFTDLGAYRPLEGDRIAFNCPVHGGALPSGVVGGKTYKAINVNPTAKTFQIAELTSPTTPKDVGDGNGWLHCAMNSVTGHLGVHSFRITMNEPNTSGINWKLNQPSEIRNLYLAMYADADPPDTPGREKAVGVRGESNGGLIDNFQLVPGTNVLGYLCNESWMTVQGFMDVNGPGQGIRCGGHHVTFAWLGGESCPICIELTDRASVTIIEGMHSCPVYLKDSSGGSADWYIGRLKGDQGAITMVRSDRFHAGEQDLITVDDWPAVTGISDRYFSVGPIVQPAVGLGEGIRILDRGVYPVPIAGDAHARQRFDTYLFDCVAANRNFFLHYAENYSQGYKVKRDAGANSIIVKRADGTTLTTIATDTMREIIPVNGAWKVIAP